MVSDQLVMHDHSVRHRFQDCQVKHEMSTEDEAKEILYCVVPKNAHSCIKNGIYKHFLSIASSYYDADGVNSSRCVGLLKYWHICDPGRLAESVVNGR